MEALARSEVFRLAIEAAPAGMLITDRAGTIVLVNAQVERIFGYARDELIGQPIEVLVPSTLHAAHRAHRASFQAAATTRAMGGGAQLHGVRRDGSLVPIEIGLNPFRTATAELVLSSITDVSEREAARDRGFLLELGEQLRARTTTHDVVGAVMRPIARHFAVARCSFVEIDAARGLATLYRDHLPGEPAPREVVPLAQLGQVLHDVLARGELAVVDDCELDPRLDPAALTGFRARGLRSTVAVPLLRGERWVAQLVVSDDQPRRWQPRELALLRLAAERVWGWVEQLRLLEEVRGQAIALAVERTEARLHVLVNGITDYAIMMLDGAGVITTWNTGAERLFGYPASEAVGQPAAWLWPDDDQAHAAAAAALDEARRHGRCEHEGWRRRRDGALFWVSGELTAVRASDGSLDGFASVTCDVTERRRTDEALRANQAALRQSLQEREVLLQEIHHRVKNNLQIIASLIRMQSRRLTAGDARDALDECQTRVIAIALIHSTLYESRDYAAIRFAEYTRGLVANIVAVTNVNPHRVRLELAIADVALSIDRAIPVALVLNELITNALKHAFPGDRTGTLWVTLVALDEDRLRLTVRDDGVGLPASFAIGTLTSLGLFLVTTLAEQLGAILEVLAAPGAGFQLTFSNKG